MREGNEVTLTAKPGDFDHKFVKWEVTGITLTEAEAKANPITFTMGNTDVTVKAVFEKKEAVIINFNGLNFTYDGTQKTPEIGPEEVVGMDRTIEYFDSLNNKLKSAPNEAGTYKVKVTFTSSEASEYRTTWADATFTIARADQKKPAEPTVTDIKSDSFVVAFDKKQEYQDNTDRIEVERTFSLSKRCYGMSCITTKLEETQLTSIALSVFVTNLFRIQRRILYALLHLFRFWHDWNRCKNWKLQISA